MKLKTIVPVLLLVLLLILGCSQSGVSHLSQADGGLPPFTSMKGTGTLSPSQNNHFSFAVFGDSQGDEKSRIMIGKIFEEINQYQPVRPVFAFCLGDIVKGKDPQDPTKHIRQKFSDYLELAKTAGVPVFNTPGNHEMDDADDIPSERMQKIYQESVGPTHGSFDYGNSHFIALNTEDVPPAGTPPPPKGVEFSFISDKQLAQLDKDLEANRDKTHIFVMMHYPMKPHRRQDILNPASLKKVINIFKKYDNIAYVFASHEHLFYNPQDPGNVETVAPFSVGDPTRYLVSGGAGASIYVDGAEGGFHHYLIIEVDGDKISVKIHKMDG
ncbi:MAG: hypothetical protein HN590_06460 [Calditrichaeota bacterium]|nr:hypothetical protein [Calditrichota bacterium]